MSAVKQIFGEADGPVYRPNRLPVWECLCVLLLGTVALLSLPLLAAAGWAAERLESRARPAGKCPGPSERAGPG